MLIRGKKFFRRVDKVQKKSSQWQKFELTRTRNSMKFETRVSNSRHEKRLKIEVKVMLIKCVPNRQSSLWNGENHDQNGKVLQNLDNSDLLKTKIAYNTPIFTAVTRNHGNGQKSRYTAKIMVITAIVNSWFSYSPTYHGTDCLAQLWINTTR